MVRLSGALRRGVIRTVVMAMLAAMVTITTATVGAGTAAAAVALSCDALYAVNNNDSNAYRIDPADGAPTKDFKLLSTTPNQLGIGAGGAYAVYTGPDSKNSPKIFKYDALTGATSSVDRPDGYATQQGAVNPSNGLYYFGGYDNGAFKYRVYDPSTNMPLTGDVKVTVTPAPGSRQTNGDIAFDAVGNLYIVSSSSSDGLVYSVPGPVAAGSVLTGTGITAKAAGFANATSAAFGPDGYLYVGRTGSSDLTRLNPATGATVTTLRSMGMYDLGSCSDPYSIELRKDLPAGRAADGDQFLLEVTGGGVSTGNTATTTGNTTGIQSVKVGPLLGLPGTEYTIKETAKNGADLANYNVTWQCLDAKTNAKLSSGTGASGKMSLPSTKGGASVVCTFTNGSLKSGLALEKTAAPNTAADLTVGNTITYSFKMTNTGDVTLKDVKPVEKDFSGKAKMSDFSCPEGAKSLAAKASVTCTATYVLQQEDIDRGTVDNTAIATGTDPGGKAVNSAESKVPLKGGPATPGISIVKSASPKDAESYKLGQTIKYSFKITNTGDVTLRNVGVNEGAFTGAGPLSAVECPDTAKALGPKASVTCTAEYTLTQKDIDNGRIENTATATGTPPGTDTPIVSPPGKEIVEGNPARSLSLVKDASPSTTADYKVGQEISYTFLIKNTGDVTLTDVHPNETKFSGSGDMSTFDCPAGAASLAPGASVTCTAKYTLTQADIDAGKLENTATATGTPPSGEPVTSKPSDKTLSGEPKPAIALEKSASPTDPDKFAVGETVTYSFTITNTGNVTLKDVRPNETAFTGESSRISAFDCPDAAKSLAPNESVTCTATYTLDQADVDRGKLDNAATATGTPPSGGPVTSDEDDAKLTGNQKPNLEIVKTASPKGVSDFKVGQKVTYTFDVTNTGNQTLTDVKVVEGAFSGSGELSDVSCPEEVKSMAPGAEVSCTATYELTQKDIDAGKLDNVATAVGTPPGADTPIESPQDEENLAGDPQAGLKLEKTAEPRENVQVNDTVTYKFTITNTGDQTLKDVGVKENEFSGKGTLSAISCPDDAKELNPGKSVTCETTYTFTVEDMNVGRVENTATATGTPPSGTPIESDPSDVDVTGAQAPQLEVVKSASLTSLDGFKAGAKVKYSFAVTNTGNVTVANVSIKEGDFSGTGEITDLSCPEEAKSLVPGAQVTCTALYELTQADVDAGKVENTATAIGTPPGTEEPIESPPSDGGIEGNPNPDLSIVKTASISDSSDFTVGKEITYSFVITNTGDVTLTDVRPNEKSFTGSGPMSDPVCEAGASALAPNDAVTCTANYTLTQADIDAGTLDNVATATGTPPGKEPIESPESQVALPGHPHPGISIVKKANPREKVKLGQEVTYRFVITNVGDVTLKDVTVNEGDFTGTGTMSAITCPDKAKSLAPKDSVACTATYVVTRADVKNGRIDNVATASGTNPKGDEVVSEPSNETVTPDKSSFPGLIIIPIIPGLLTGSLGSTGSTGPAGEPAGTDTPVIDGNPTGEGNQPGQGGAESGTDAETQASNPKGGLIDSGLGADGDGGLNSGLVAGGLALLIAAGGVLVVALRRRRAEDGDVTDL
ncbi:DUF7507 domain-containing protein [Prescottella equi]|uniref:DUF7507 domain-containing protein n=1 Tax=Rhodococcus hoagii TaxID=43767 RepID=UPI000A0FE440|nr:DUF11 domain-containing protein [Prescottella equi]ORM05986.1 hypothetical protein A5N73_04215 [Prescottella equi]